MCDKLVVNELLAFLQQKLDVMDEISAVQICTSNFSQDDIAKAKVLLYESLNKSEQMVSRRRDGTHKSLEDIIALLKVTDPDDVPTFVAKDINKLPPVTFDHVDVTCLLKDIVSLKKSLADVTLRLNVSEGTIIELRKEVDSLRDSRKLSRSSDDTRNVNTRRGACLDESAATIESAFSPTTDAVTPRADVVPRPAPPARTPRAPAPLQVEAAPAKSAVLLKRQDFATVAAKKPTTQRNEPKVTLKMTPMCTKSADRDDDGFVTVQKKRRTKRVNRNHCGTALTGPNFLLRAATPTTAMYLSRLHYATKEQDIVDYIRTKSNLTLRVTQLESSHNASFKAFVALVPTNMLPTFMKEGYWPKGVVYRRHRGRLPSSVP